MTSGDWTAESTAVQSCAFQIGSGARLFVPSPAEIMIIMTSLGIAARLPGVTADLDALLRRAAERDVEAFTAFYDATRARVYGLVTRVLRDPGYSEETTQDIYLQVWHNAANYDPAAGSPLAWLMTLAHRRAVDRVRSEQAASQRESRYGAANVEPAADRVAEAVIHLRSVARSSRASTLSPTHSANAFRWPITRV